MGRRTGKKSGVTNGGVSPYTWSLQIDPARMAYLADFHASVVLEKLRETFGEPGIAFAGLKPAGPSLESEIADGALTLLRGGGYDAYAALLLRPAFIVSWRRRTFGEEEASQPLTTLARRMLEVRMLDAAAAVAEAYHQAGLGLLRAEKGERFSATRPLAVLRFRLESEDAIWIVLDQVFCSLFPAREEEPSATPRHPGRAMIERLLKVRVSPAVVLGSARVAVAWLSGLSVGSRLCLPDESDGFLAVEAQRIAPIEIRWTDSGVEVRFLPGRRDLGDDVWITWGTRPLVDRTGYAKRARVQKPFSLARYCPVVIQIVLCRLEMSLSSMASLRDGDRLIVHYAGGGGAVAYLTVGDKTLAWGEIESDEGSGAGQGRVMRITGVNVSGRRIAVPLRQWSHLGQ